LQQYFAALPVVWDGDGMSAFLKRLFVFGIAAHMSLVAVAMALVGGLFVWKLLTHDRAEVTFDAPNGRWSVHIEDSCFSGSCYKYPTIVVSEGWFSSRELQCDMHGADTSRVLFDTVHSATWENGDTTLVWSAGDPPVSGRIDLRKDCYATAAFDDRPNLISLRFKENCLTEQCWRSVDWIESRGGYVYTTPCRVVATGNAPVFTLPGDALGQVSVTLDPASRQARWTSQTGQGGLIDYAADCDATNQTRHEQPP
jgi:hypothetical protein